MKDVLNFSGAAILAISENEPEKLFTSISTFEIEFKNLAKKFHPDVGGDGRVFAHINRLRRVAAERAKSGSWQEPNVFRFTSVGGQDYRFRYLKKAEFELGDLFISATLMAYRVGPEHIDNFWKPTDRLLRNLKFADEKMRQVVGRDLPNIRDTKMLKDGSAWLVLEKGTRRIRVRDLAAHFGGYIPAPHAAWIISRLLSHAVYLEWSGMTHNDISMDTVFIDPEDHTAALLGGWWYAAPVGSTLTYLPARTVNAGPASLKINKKATTRTDAELIKLMAREMLGPDAAHDCPAIFKWSLTHQSSKALDTLRNWSDKVLPAAFGPKKFVPLDVQAAEVYKV